MLIDHHCTHCTTPEQFRNNDEKKLKLTFKLQQQLDGVRLASAVDVHLLLTSSATITDHLGRRH